MPPAIDLTGRKLGKLTVLSPMGTSSAYECRLWLCQCDCGRQLEVPQRLLPYTDWVSKQKQRAVSACAVCDGKPCVVCGAIIPRSKRSPLTCPGECHRVYRNKQIADNSRKRYASDPATREARRQRNRRRNASRSS